MVFLSLVDVFGRFPAGWPVTGDAAAPAVEGIEGKYGAKLDRMPGGPTAGHTDKGSG